MIHILGGKRVAINFHRLLNANGIANKLYFFEGEDGARLRDSTPFIPNWHQQGLPSFDERIVVSSETAFNNFQDEEVSYFQNHFFLRNKLNIGSISEEIGTKQIPIIGVAELPEHYPVIAKPRRSGTKVPFKFILIKNSFEFQKVEQYANECIFQPFFDNSKYKQVAIAGYFLNDESSLIAVDQLNQYPIGVSSHVRLIEHDLTGLKRQVSEYLLSIGFTGFIEFEFKIDKTQGTAYLIDVNPRLWGWSYFYLSGIKNVNDVFSNNKTPILGMKKEWINLPRYAFSISKGRISCPKSFSVELEPIF